MGCDIHAYVEYVAHSYDLNEAWDCLIENIGRRDYALFGILAGVRTDFEPVVQPRGLPEGCTSWAVESASRLRVVDDPECADGEGYCTRAQAEQWGHAIEDLGDLQYTYHPDWHTHSWLTADELALALGRYMFEVGRPYNVEWDAVLAAMRAFEDRGVKTRLVFWFDN